ncbi:hypothetical protein [Allopusillimonas ginsengisoli]|uniref:hypothetical protein n=1 Tax=Allopusillimonas ginsengisoli TaxID=453575 RepID=UPI00101FDE5E|nr:hypothetical protein [Allopusillimonas ginsengisoli]TEA79806.1 hypothetical protein ERE07_02370 [Allopusillimonas ginsengisoli]
MQSSNWPGGIDRSHSNYTLKFPRTSRYDGQGGWAKDSAKIPLVDATLFVVGTAAIVWATVRVATWIWG